MRRHAGLIALALGMAGCATTRLPDGSRIQRLAPSDAAAIAPVSSPEEPKRLAQLNAQVLADQQAAREREMREETWRRAQRQWAVDLH